MSDRHLALLKHLTLEEAAKLTGLSSTAIRRIKEEAGIAKVSERNFTYPRHKWSRKDINMLGKMPDKAIAEKLGISINAVSTHRIRRGIPAYGKSTKE